MGSHLESGFQIARIVGTDVYAVIRVEGRGAAELGLLVSLQCVAPYA